MESRLLFSGGLLGRLPLSFEPNVGQAPAGFDYIARGQGYRVLVAGDGAVLALQSGMKSAEIRMTLEGADASAPLDAADEQVGKSNYFLGNDPSAWHAGVSHFGRVVQHGVYPGIDVAYHAAGPQLEYDFILAPRADAKAVRMRFSGVDSMRVDGHGDLVLETAAGRVVERKPSAYQEIDGSRRHVSARYILRDGQVRLVTGRYDATQPLVIDPTLSYSTFYGGSSDDHGTAIRVDSAGNIYVAGDTTSEDFPITSRPFSASIDPSGYGDIFVSKIDPTGQSLIYSTYVGGSGDEEATGLAIDADGNAIVVGLTGLASSSLDFPTTPDALRRQKMNFDTDGLVFKVNADGSDLLYSTYFGGQHIADGSNLAENHPAAVAVEAGGRRFYVTGYTSATDFPTTAGAFDRSSAGAPFTDGFVTRFNANDTLSYSTYLGGGLDDDGAGIIADAAGNAYVTGTTRSADFPKRNPYQSQLAAAGLDDGFVTKVNPTGSDLVYSTYLGGDGNDEGMGIALDPANNVYVTGFTRSDNFPRENAAQTQFGGDDTTFPADAFLSSLDASGHVLRYSSYLGGDNADVGTAVTVDASGVATITGYTSSNNFPTQAPLPNLGQPRGGTDAIVAQFDTRQIGKSSLLFSTYLGGDSDDQGNAIAPDGAGGVYVFGTTSSENFPLQNPGQSPYQGGDSDTFISRITFASPGVGVAAVYVDGSAWKQSFNSYLQSHSLGTSALGFKVPDPGPNSDELPWVNLDTISVQLSGALPAGVTLNASRVHVTNSAGQTLALQSVAYNASTLVGTIRLSQSIASATRLHVGLDLNTSPGIDQDVRLNVLPGDVDRGGGAVNAADLVQTRNRIGRTTANPGSGATAYSPFADVNGSGVIEAADLVGVRNRIGTSLPAALSRAVALIKRRRLDEPGDGEDEPQDFI